MCSFWYPRTSIWGSISYLTGSFSIENYIRFEIVILPKKYFICLAQKWSGYLWCNLHFYFTLIFSRRASFKCFQKLQKSVPRKNLRNKNGKKWFLMKSFSRRNCKEVFRWGAFYSGKPQLLRSLSATSIKVSKLSWNLASVIRHFSSIRSISEMDCCNHNSEWISSVRRGIQTKARSFLLDHSIYDPVKKFLIFSVQLTLLSFGRQGIRTWIVLVARACLPLCLHHHGSNHDGWRSSCTTNVTLTSHSSWSGIMRLRGK